MDLVGVFPAVPRDLPDPGRAAHEIAVPGIAAFVRPEGSVRGAEIIAVCEARGLAMVFTDRRVFRH